MIKMASFSLPHKLVMERKMSVTLTWARKCIADLNVFIFWIFFSDFKTSINRLLRIFIKSKKYLNIFKLFKTYRIKQHPVSIIQMCPFICSIQIVF